MIDFSRLRPGADTRASGTIETMPDALFAEVEAAVDAYASEDETSGEPTDSTASTPRK